MDVATRKKSFLRSDVISKYKEVHKEVVTLYRYICVEFVDMLYSHMTNDKTMWACARLKQCSVVILSWQVQIHGPVSLSENVDCIVANERHKSCPATVKLLEEFVEKNQCNLIWMEPLASIDYPRFGTLWHPEYWYTQALTSESGATCTHWSWLPKLWDHVTFMYYSIIQCIKSFINCSIICMFDCLIRLEKIWTIRQFARAQFKAWFWKKRCVNI